MNKKYRKRKKKIQIKLRKFKKQNDTSKIKLYTDVMKLLKIKYLYKKNPEKAFLIFINIFDPNHSYSSDFRFKSAYSQYINLIRMNTKQIPLYKHYKYSHNIMENRQYNDDKSYGLKSGKIIIDEDIYNYGK